MRLLIVEDDALMRDLLATLAVSIDENLNIVEADSVEAALQLWHDGNIELILCDWHLPLPLRERIGASHWLPGDAVRRELILMRVAACGVHGDTNSPEYRRAERQLGLDS